MAAKLTLYEKDFYAWTETQADLIKSKSFSQLDFRHIYEEIKIMGAREKTELKSRLSQLLMHLLKWKYQKVRRSRSWKNSIYDQREELQDLLSDNPSLSAKISEFFVKAYKKALRDASSETGFDESLFPKVCEWDINQVLNEEFFPE